MVAPTRRDLNLKKTKRREAWETELRIALYQKKCIIDNLKIFENNLGNVLHRYEQWLQRLKIEPTLNLDIYRKAK